MTRSKINKLSRWAQTIHPDDLVHSLAEYAIATLAIVIIIHHHFIINHQFISRFISSIAHSSNKRRTAHSLHRYSLHTYLPCRQKSQIWGSWKKIWSSITVEGFWKLGSKIAFVLYTYTVNRSTSPRHPYTVDKITVNEKKSLKTRKNRKDRIKGIFAKFSSKEWSLNWCKRERCMT